MSTPSLGQSTHPIYISDSELPPNVKKINLSPLFKPLHVYAILNIHEEDPIKLIPYSILIEEKERKQQPYVLALIKEKHCGESNFCCVDGASTWEWVQTHGTHPITTDKINKIFYFTINNCRDETFEFLCHSEQEYKIEYLKLLLDPEIEDSSRQVIQKIIQERDIEEKEIKTERQKTETTAQEDWELHLRYETSHDPNVYLHDAFSLCKSAADKGLTVAQHKIGLAYRDGTGTKRNLTLAQYYLHFAAALNFKDSKEILQKIQSEAQYREDESGDDSKSSDQLNDGIKPILKRKREEDSSSSESTDHYEKELKTPEAKKPRYEEHKEKEKSE